MNFFSKKNYLYEFVFPNVFSGNASNLQLTFFSEKIKILKNYFFRKKVFQNQKVPKTYFFMKRKFPKQSTWKNFFSKKIYWKKFFSKKHFEVNFFYEQYITEKFHIFSKKLKKKIRVIVILIFKKIRTKIVQKKVG